MSRVRVTLNYVEVAMLLKDIKDKVKILEQYLEEQAKKEDAEFLKNEDDE